MYFLQQKITFAAKCRFMTECMNAHSKSTGTYDNCYIFEWRQGKNKPGNNHINNDFGAWNSYE